MVSWLLLKFCSQDITHAGVQARSLPIVAKGYLRKPVNHTDVEYSTHGKGFQQPRLFDNGLRSNRLCGLIVKPELSAAAQTVCANRSGEVKTVVGSRQGIPGEQQYKWQVHFGPHRRLLQI